jgi:hypothetical protein
LDLKTKHVCTELGLTVGKPPSLPQLSIIGSGKRRHDVFEASLLPYFTPAAFYFFLKVKSEQASC